MPFTYDPGGEPVSRTYTSQGLKLNYLDWGNAGAAPLFLVHGMWDHARSWDRVAGVLRNEWHVIVPDLRGHGVRRDGDGYRWKYDPAIGNLSPEDFSIDLAHYWRAITAPTLLCWGPKSWTTDPATDGSAACFQHASTLTFDRSGHWLHHEQPDAFIEAVSAFLRGNRRQP